MTPQGWLLTPKVAGFFFDVGSDNNLVPNHVANRLLLPMEGRCSFLQSTCMVNLRASCMGVLAVYQAYLNAPWKLIVISGLFDMRRNGDDTIQFFEWTGSSTSGCPQCFHYSSWDEMEGDFQQKELLLSQIKSFHFVNQMRGIVPMKGVIRQDTRNPVDGGVQCSALGPDVWCIPKPTFYSSKSITFKDCEIKSGDSSCSNLLVHNQAMNKPKKRRKIRKTIPQEESYDVINFHIPPKRIPDKNQLGVLVIVKDDQGRDINSSITSKINSPLKGTLNFGSIKC